MEANDKLQGIADKFLPFYVKLGKTSSFPPSVSSDGAGVIIVKVVSPILAKMHEAISNECDCVPYSFEYTPHATVAYVKPELRHNYEDLTDLEGYEFLVTEIMHSDRYGECNTYRRKK